MSDKGLKDEVLSSQQGIVLTPEQVRGRRVRNIAIGLGVTFLAVLFYAVTIVRLGSVVANRSI
ncbi:hypothetical protein LBMAG20_10330 [Methylocystaceae bacterium]|nr:hypothetical protein LBMAG20_10330 [Methylocystaceae bacterium]